MLTFLGLSHSITILNFSQDLYASTCMLWPWLYNVCQHHTKLKYTNKFQKICGILLLLWYCCLKFLTCKLPGFITSISFHMWTHYSNSIKVKRMAYVKYTRVVSVWPAWTDQQVWKKILALSLHQQVRKTLGWEDDLTHWWELWCILHIRQHVLNVMRHLNPFFKKCTGAEWQL